MQYYLGTPGLRGSSFNSDAPIAGRKDVTIAEGIVAERTVSKLSRKMIVQTQPARALGMTFTSKAPKVP